MEELSSQVVFRKLSHWQNRTCLFCSDDAMQEAFLYHLHGASSVRCCDNIKCKAEAVVLAAEMYLSNDKRMQSA